MQHPLQALADWFDLRQPYYIGFNTTSRACLGIGREYTSRTIETDPSPRVPADRKTPPPTLGRILQTSVHGPIKRS